MNKFRILTTDNEWVYSQVEVLGARLVCPLANAEGAQFLKPNLEFRPETLGYALNIKDHHQKEIYEGDIGEWRRSGRHRRVIIQWGKDTFCWECLPTDLSLPYSDDYVTDVGQIATEGESVAGLEIIGNIHQNPELVNNSDNEEKKE